ncbi:DUF4360 domain-containing protein [Candidatus Electronema sp. TJ]|uniref:DUF4360 domain-containing protein n=1 Tax=Candidatus Electronema sp. TJ TaxID=3401573 RepID=UPI003AA92F6B
MKVLLVPVLLACAATQATAQGNPYFKTPVEINGTGCSPSDITVTGENSATMTIMFSKYDAGNQKPSVSGIGRTSCNFAVPVHVPSGYQVSLLTADWMGFAEGETEFSRRYFFAGQPVPPVTVKPVSGRGFTYTDSRLYGSYRKCGGGDLQLRINSWIWAKGKPSYIAVDTLDLNNRMILKLNWQKCQ